MSTAFAFEHTEVKPKTIQLDISPSLAGKYLEHNINNRPISSRYIDGLVQVMKAGKFDISHQGIAFDVDGNLVDGQHRLTAVMKSGVTIPMFVTTNLPKKSLLSIDSGYKRTYLQNKLLLGVDMHPAIPAAARAMLTSDLYKRHSIPNTTLDDIVHKHQEALNFAVNAFFSESCEPALRVATMLAVVARAYYTADLNRLKQFVKILVTGVTANQEDLAAIRLRDYRLLNAVSGLTERWDLYKKAESALNSFLMKKTINRLDSAKEELFPIPE